MLPERMESPQEADQRSHPKHHQAERSLSIRRPSFAQSVRSHAPHFTTRCEPTVYPFPSRTRPASSLSKRNLLRVRTRRPSFSRNLRSEDPPKEGFRKPKKKKGAADGTPSATLPSHAFLEIEKGFFRSFVPSLLLFLRSNLTSKEARRTRDASERIVELPPPTMECGWATDRRSHRPFFLSNPLRAMASSERERQRPDSNRQIQVPTLHGGKWNKSWMKKIEAYVDGSEGWRSHPGAREDIHRRGVEDGSHADLGELHVPTGRMKHHSYDRNVHDQQSKRISLEIRRGRIHEKARRKRAKHPFIPPIYSSRPRTCPRRWHRTAWHAWLWDPHLRTDQTYLRCVGCS